MRSRNKKIYRILIITSFIGVITLLLFGISQVLSYLNTGADRASMLHLPLVQEEVYLPKVIWKDTINPGRPIEDQTLKNIQKDYLNAWYVRQIAYQNYDASGIKDYYTESAQLPIFQNIEVNKEKEISIHSTTTNHNISVDFYSADGQLVVLTDKGVKEHQHVYQGEKLIFQTEFTSDYQTLLLLEDGFWRIRHIIKEANASNETVSTPLGIAKVVGDKIYVADQEYQVKGINYYPQKTPWAMYGDGFDIEVISQDFDILKKAGLNTVRIFIPYEDFGKARVQNTKLEKLQHLLDKANEKGLKVIATLFDFYGDYSVLDWTLTHRHAEQIVTTFKNHKAILAWDIKNEPNLDFESRGEENVLAWLKEMIIQIRKFDPNHLITIGWSDIKSAILLENNVDIVSFHYYMEIDDFEEHYLSLKSRCTKPIVLQEFGLSSNQGFWAPFGVSEKKQAKYHQQFQEIFRGRDIHFLSWTLYDFEEVPGEVVGSLPWRKHKQKHFGFIDSQGNKKPAFEFMTYH